MDVLSYMCLKTSSLIKGWRNDLALYSESIKNVDNFAYVHVCIQILKRYRHRDYVFLNISKGLKNVAPDPGKLIGRGISIVRAVFL
jgi:hypothetical protein